MILFFGRDGSGMLKIRQKDCFHYKNKIRRLQFTPDGLDLLFSLDENSWWYRKRFVILSLNSQGKWLETKTFNFPAPASYPPQFSPDGSCFVIYSLQDGTFKFFNNSQPRQVASLRSYRRVFDRLYNAAFSPRCRWVQQVSDPNLRGINPRFSPDGISVKFLIPPVSKLAWQNRWKGVGLNSRTLMGDSRPSRTVLMVRLWQASPVINTGMMLYVYLPVIQRVTGPRLTVISTTCLQWTKPGLA